MEGKYASKLRVRTSYALQRTREGQTGTELSSSPRHLAKTGCIYPFGGDRFTAGLELQYQGAMRTLAGGRTRGFLIGNLTLASHQIVRGVELSASVYNFLNTTHGYPGSEDHVQDVIPQPGRTFSLRVAYKF